MSKQFHNMRTVKFHDLLHMQKLELDYDQRVLSTFIKSLITDSTTNSDLDCRRLCLEFLNCDVWMEGRRPAVQNFDPSSEGSTMWYNFMRSITFIGSPVNPDLRYSLPEGHSANLFGSLTEAHQTWETRFELSVYVPDGGDPGKDHRIPSKKRYDIRQQPRMLSTRPCWKDGHDAINAALPVIVDTWSNKHAHSYGPRNGFTQLCLWRWLQANMMHGTGALFVSSTHDLESTLAGFVKTDLGWVFQTYWQSLELSQPLGSATLRSVLPLMPAGETIYLTCPSVTGDPNDSRYEIYKKKFATGGETSFAAFLAPFEAQPPYYHTGLKETVL